MGTKFAIICIPDCLKNESEPTTLGKTKLTTAESILPNKFIKKEDAIYVGKMTGIKLTFEEDIIQCYRKNEFHLIKEISGIVVLILTQLPFFLHRLSIVGLLVIFRVFHFANTSNCDQNGLIVDGDKSNDKCNEQYLSKQNWRAVYVIFFCAVRVWSMLFALVLQDR